MLTIEYIPITDIKPYARNAKLHPPEQIEQIKASIQAFGFNDPLGIWRGEIVEGHGRYLAAQELGMDTLPVIRLDDLTDEQRRAYMLAHNKLTMNSGFDIDLLNSEIERIMDFDMSAFGFDFTEEEEENAVEEDYYQEEEVTPRTKYGDRYRLGDHVLLCGDATKADDVAKLMGGNTIDLLITDPPYNVDYASKNEMLNYSDKGSRIQTPIKNDKMDDKRFLVFLKDAFFNISTILKQGGAYYIWYSEATVDAFRNALTANGLLIKQTIIWNKNNFVIGRQDYQWKHEPCLYGWKDGAGHYFIDSRSQTTVYEDKKPDIRKMKKQELVALLESIYEQRTPTSVLDVDKPYTSDLHPTMKPLKLMGMLIRNSSRPGEAVADIFGGSGSTMMACEQLGRRCYTMELDPHYCDVIIDRWEKYTGKTAEKIA